MLRIRLEGKPEDVEEAKEKLKEIFEIFKVSNPYPNRDNDNVRVYVNAEMFD